MSFTVQSLQEQQCLYLARQLDKFDNKLPFEVYKNPTKFYLGHE